MRSGTRVVSRKWKKMLPLMAVDFVLLGISIMCTWLSWPYLTGREALPKDHGNDSALHFPALKYSVACSQYDVAGFLIVRLSLMFLTLYTRRDVYVLATGFLQLFGSGLLLAKVILPIAYRVCHPISGPVYVLGVDLIMWIPPAVAFVAYDSSLIDPIEDNFCLCALYRQWMYYFTSLLISARCKSLFMVALSLLKLTEPSPR